MTCETDEVTGEIKDFFETGEVTGELGEGGVEEDGAPADSSDS